MRFSHKNQVANLSETDVAASPVSASPIVFPNRIRRLREDINLSLTDLSQLCDWSVPHLSYVERGFRRPSDAKAAKIAKVLNVGPERLEVRPEDGEEYSNWVGILEERRREAAPAFLFGQRLRSMRNALGLSTRELCVREPSLSPWQVRNFEVYGREPTQAELRALSQAFNFRSVVEFEAALEAVEVDRSVSASVLESKREAVRRKRGRAATAGVEGQSDEKAPRGAMSIDGDQLGESEWLLKGAVVRIIREAHLIEGMAYVVMSGKRAVGIGRASRGRVLVGKPEKALIGVPWRVTSIGYPDRLF